MITLRKAMDRGHSQIGCLESYHTFSFADYHDNAWVHFETLRVINEDYIQPSKGFDMHPHRDMEIITYVISGALKHQDSMGNGSIIKPGEIQRMSAGTGVQHSEFNDSDTDVLRLLQIWVLPANKGITPGYEQKKISQRNNELTLIGSNHPTSQAVMIHQNMNLYVAFCEAEKRIFHSLSGRPAWLQLIKGCLQVNDEMMEAGDGIGLRKEEQLVIQCIEPAEFLLFEMKI